jgi:hypothetical protein
LDDNSFYGAPAGWYPEPLGLPQLRWWDSTAWTHQTAEARAPMVMQETTYAWPEDEAEPEQDLPTRRERRERERRDNITTLAPTAFTLLELEPPSAADVQRPGAADAGGADAAPPAADPQSASAAQEAAFPNPLAASRAASLQDQPPAAHSVTAEDACDAPPLVEPPLSERSRTDSPLADAPPTGQPLAEPASGATPTFDWMQREAAQAAPGFETPAPSPDYARSQTYPQAQTYAQPQPMQQAPLFPQTTTVPAAPHKSTNNFAVWMIALIPLAQLVLTLLTLTAVGSAEASPVMVAIWLVPYPLAIGLAAIDRQLLRKAGHEYTAHWAWALLTAPVYLIVRAVAAIRESGNGFGPVLVWFALGLLQVGSIVAVPGLLISTVPAVFADQAEQSIVSDAAVIGAQLEVECPSPAVLIDQSFFCDGTTSAGEDIEIEVSLQRVNGWIDWQVIDWGVYTLG